MPWPGPSTLLPVVGASLIIAFASPGNPVGKALGHKALVGIGLISYSAYLWHQPLLAFARIRLLDGVPASVTLGLVAASFLIAAVSWRWVEQPFRHRSEFSRRQVAIGAAAFGTVMSLVGVAGHLAHGWPQRMSAEAAQMARFTEWSGHITDPETGAELVPRASRCVENFDTVGESIATCTWGQPGAPIVAVWGDSHSRPIAWRLQRALPASAFRIQQLSRSACFPVPTVGRLGRRDTCTEFSDEALAYLINSKEVTLVVIAAFWPNIGALNTLPLDPAPDEPAGAATLAQHAAATVKRLLDAGKRVVFVHTVPSYSLDVARYSARRLMLHEPTSDPDHPVAISLAAHRRQPTRQEMRSAMSKVSRAENLLEIYPDDVFCDRWLRGQCVAQLGPKPLYVDGSHLSRYGAEFLVDYILEAVARKWNALASWSALRAVPSQTGIHDAKSAVPGAPAFDFVR
jgi:hypothetical protein